MWRYDNNKKNNIYIYDMKKQIYIYIYKYIHHDMEKLVPTCIYIYISLYK